MTDEDTLNDAADATEATETTETTDAADEPAGDRGSVLSRRFVVAVAAATLALIVAVVFGVLWWSTTASDEYQVASDRDKVIAAAEKAVLAFTEIDYKNPNSFLDRKREVSTDDLYDQVTQSWKKARELIVDQQIAVRVKVLDVGVEKLDTRKGDAVALAVIKVSKLAKESEQADVQMRMVMGMKRAGDEWKLADIGNAPEFGG
jgi:Mce-associated membrane protein